MEGAGSLQETIQANDEVRRAQKGLKSIYLGEESIKRDLCENRGERKKNYHDMNNDR